MVCCDETIEGEVMAMKTIREEAFGNVRLRILETGDSYTGIVISNGKVTECSWCV
jgi:hypothetical protein